MFRKREDTRPLSFSPSASERVTSVLGSGIAWKGNLGGSGGLRIEGSFEGNINVRGLVVVAETGKVTCDHLRANSVIVAGAVRGDITAEKVEVRSSGRVWGDVVTAAFATEEGAFLRGQIRMEERVELGSLPEPDSEAVSKEASQIDTGAPAGKDQPDKAA